MKYLLSVERNVALLEGPAIDLPLGPPAAAYGWARHYCAIWKPRDMGVSQAREGMPNVRGWWRPGWFSESSINPDRFEPGLPPLPQPCLSGQLFMRGLVIGSTGHHVRTPLPHTRSERGKVPPIWASRAGRLARCHQKANRKSEGTRESGMCALYEEQQLICLPRARRFATWPQDTRLTFEIGVIGLLLVGPAAEVDDLQGAGLLVHHDVLILDVPVVDALLLAGLDSLDYLKTDTMRKRTVLTQRTGQEDRRTWVKKSRVLSSVRGPCSEM